MIQPQYQSSKLSQKSKERLETMWMKLYLMSYLNLKTEIIILYLTFDIRFGLVFGKVLGIASQAIQKLPIKLFFDAFVYGFLYVSLCCLIGVFK